MDWFEWLGDAEIDCIDYNLFQKEFRSPQSYWKTFVHFFLFQSLFTTVLTFSIGAEHNMYAECNPRCQRERKVEILRLQPLYFNVIFHFISPPPQRYWGQLIFFMLYGKVILRGALQNLVWMTSFHVVFQHKL